MKPARPRPRALLVASIGVATVSYALAGCGKTTRDEPPTSGNLAGPEPVLLDAAPPPVPEPLAVVDSGALVAVDAGDAGRVAPDAGKPVTKPPQPRKPPPTSGNLMAP